MISAIIFIVIIFIIVSLPVKIAAGMVGAKKTDWLRCFFAVVMAVAINAIAGVFFRYGGLAGLFVSGLGFMLVLDTSYLRGVGIAVLSLVIAYLLAIVLVALALVPSAEKILGFSAVSV